MLVLKYEKNGAMRFISHIDLLRHFVRIMRRANIEVEFSNGFNPHMLVFFSPPLPLGLSSEAEYVAVETKNVCADEFLARYNAAAPDGLKASAVFEVVKEPRLQALAHSADFVLPFALNAEELEKVNQDYALSYQKKGEAVNETVGDRMFSISSENGKTYVRAAVGNVTLRVDRLAVQMATDFQKELDVTKIIKRALYLKDGENIICADEYLINKKREV